MAVYDAARFGQRAVTNRLCLQSEKFAAHNLRERWTPQLSNKVPGKIRRHMWLLMLRQLIM
ncbi:MAG: hypothetical protein DWI62_04705 [Chloroflexi bacterium]|nr:MAG: hypothetical protein DWI62_04705 [Chloroflexota bacterium]